MWGLRFHQPHVDGEVENIKCKIDISLHCWRSVEFTMKTICVHPSSDPSVLVLRISQVYNSHPYIITNISFCLHFCRDQLVWQALLEPRDWSLLESNVEPNLYLQNIIELLPPWRFLLLPKSCYPFGIWLTAEKHARRRCTRRISHEKVTFGYEIL